MTSSKKHLHSHHKKLNHIVLLGLILFYWLKLILIFNFRPPALSANWTWSPTCWAHLPYRTSSTPATAPRSTCCPRAPSTPTSPRCTAWASGPHTRPSTSCARCWRWTRTSVSAWTRRCAIRTWTRGGCATTAACARAVTRRPAGCASTRATLSRAPKSTSTTRGSTSWPAWARWSRSCTSSSANSWAPAGCPSASTHHPQHLNHSQVRQWRIPLSCRPPRTIGSNNNPSSGINIK